MCITIAAIVCGQKRVHVKEKNHDPGELGSVGSERCGDTFQQIGSGRKQRNIMVTVMGIEPS
jgi:hypothetical protein